MSTSGAACPVCGGSCLSFPDIEHRADYPFLPGGTVAKTEDTVTAETRLFDGGGVLRYAAGAQVPKSEVKNLRADPTRLEQDARSVEVETADAGKPAGRDDLETPPPAGEDEDGSGQKAAAASKKRAPARESR
jgi:hypothetical protein